MFYQIIILFVTANRLRNHYCSFFKDFIRKSDWKYQIIRWLCVFDSKSSSEIFLDFFCSLLQVNSICLWCVIWMEYSSLQMYCIYFKVRFASLNLSNRCSMFSFLHCAFSYNCSNCVWKDDLVIEYCVVACLDRFYPDLNFAIELKHGMVTNWIWM